MNEDRKYYEECVFLQTEIECLQHQLIQKSSELNDKLKNGHEIVSKYEKFKEIVIFSSGNGKCYSFKYDTDNGRFEEITEVTYV